MLTPGLRTYFADRWYFNSTPDPARQAQRSFNQYLQRVPPEGPKVSSYSLINHEMVAE